jgi:hypothetical protein
MTTLLQNLRFTLRQLRKSPGFTITAVLTLMLAIGANAVVFGVLNALILRPLNVPQAESLFVIQHGSDSYPDYLDLRERNRSFDDVAVFAIRQSGLDTGKDPSNVWQYETSGNYFDVLRIQPYIGRFFHASDEHGPTARPMSCSPTHIGTTIFKTIAPWWAALFGSTGIRSPSLAWRLQDSRGPSCFSLRISSCPS